MEEAEAQDRLELREYRKRKLALLTKFDSLPFGRAICVPYESSDGGVQWYKTLS